MAIWKWTGVGYEKCPWFSTSTGSLKAMLYGSAMSLHDSDKAPNGYMRIVQNRSFKLVEPHIWIGMDEPSVFGKELLDTPYRKVFRGNHSQCLVNGVKAREYPETYWMDVNDTKRESIFFNRGLDCQFFWNKNTMQTALHMILWMGFKSIGFSGIDLGGKYFDDRKLTDQQIEETNLLLHQEFEFMRWFCEICNNQSISLSCFSKKSRLSELMPVF